MVCHDGTATGINLQTVADVHGMNAILIQIRQRDMDWAILFNNAISFSLSEKQIIIPLKNPGSFLRALWRQ